MTKIFFFFRYLNEVFCFFFVSFSFVDQIFSKADCLLCFLYHYLNMHYACIAQTAAQSAILRYLNLNCSLFLLYRDF